MSLSYAALPQPAAIRSAQLPGTQPSVTRCHLWLYPQRVMFPVPTEPTDTTLFCVTLNEYAYYCEHIKANATTTLPYLGIVSSSM